MSNSYMQLEGEDKQTDKSSVVPRKKISRYATSRAIFFSLHSGTTVNNLTQFVKDTTGPDRAKWGIYLTHWNLMFNVFDQLMQLLNAYEAYKKQSITEKEFEKIKNQYGTLRDLAVTLSLLVTGLYWVIEYDPEAQENSIQFIIDQLSVHGGPLALYLIDLLTNSLDYGAESLCHLGGAIRATLPGLVSLAYTGFNALYVKLGGTDENGNPYIYRATDFINSPGAATKTSFMGIAAAFAIPLTYIGVRELYQYCKTTFNPPAPQVEPDDVAQNFTVAPLSGWRKLRRDVTTMFCCNPSQEKKESKAETNQNKPPTARAPQ